MGNPHLEALETELRGARCKNATNTPDEPETGLRDPKIRILFSLKET
jgi:hypothetical protein